MENCLQKNPNIDVVYTINEPSAAGAWTALKNAGKTQSGVTIVSVDGGCAGVRNVKAGVIDATSQQYPLLMASRGVSAVVNYAKTGKKASGYTDTGVNLIAKKAVAGRSFEERRLRPRQLLGLGRPLRARAATGASRRPAPRSRPFPQHLGSPEHRPTGDDRRHLEPARPPGSSVAAARSAGCWPRRRSARCSR